MKYVYQFFQHNKKTDSILATLEAKEVTIILFFNLSNTLSKFSKEKTGKKPLTNINLVRI